MFSFLFISLSHISGMHWRQNLLSDPVCIVDADVAVCLCVCLRARVYIFISFADKFCHVLTFFHSIQFSFLFCVPEPRMAWSSPCHAMPCHAMECLSTHTANTLQSCSFLDVSLEFGACIKFNDVIETFFACHASTIHPSRILSWTRTKEKVPRPANVEEITYSFLAVFLLILHHLHCSYGRHFAKDNNNSNLIGVKTQDCIRRFVAPPWFTIQLRRWRICMENALYHKWLESIDVMWSWSDHVAIMS